MEEKTIMDTLTAQINDFLTAKLPADWNQWPLERRREFWKGDRSAGVLRRDRVCALEIWEELLGQDRDNYNQYYARKIDRIVKSIPFWRPAQIRSGPLYGRRRGFIYSVLDSIVEADI